MKSTGDAEKKGFESLPDESGRSVFSPFGLGGKLFFWFLLVALLPMAINDWISLQGASKQVQQTVDAQLTNTLTLKYRQIESFFNQHLLRLDFASSTSKNVHFIQTLGSELERSGQNAADFVKSYRWAQLSEERGQDLREFRQTFDYGDLYLIDNDGNILFSAGQGAELGKNLLNGPHADSRFGQTVRKAYLKGTPFFSDLELFPPAGPKPVGFLIRAMVNDSGERVGLLALQFSMHAIETLLTDRFGLGRSGESYLVGEDGFMRSQPRFLTQPNFLRQEVDTLAVQIWLAKEREKEHLPPKMGQQTNFTIPEGIWIDWNDQQIGHLETPYFDYHRTKVLGSFIAIEFLERLNVHWLLVAEITVREAYASAQTMQWWSAWLFLVTALLVMLLAGLFTRRIVQPLRQISQWSRRIALGHLEQRSVRTGRDELGELNDSFVMMVASLRDMSHTCAAIARGDIGQAVSIRSSKDDLGRSINQMQENMTRVVRQTEAVSRGDYTIDIQPRSDQDTLATALQRMTHSLREMAIQHDRDEWLQSGRMKLYDQMRGERDPTPLAERIIGFLATYLNAQVGVLHVRDSGESFHIMGGYALSTTDMPPYRNRTGEGLVGQVIRDKGPLLIRDIPESALRIHGGTGTFLPRQLLLYPVMRRNEVQAVVELGTLGSFDELQLLFLEQVSEGVAIAISAAMAHLYLRQALERSQQQSEELESQGEELQQANEELRQHADILQQSEEELRSQREELETINQELKIRNREMTERTEALELARGEIELKAEQLVQANRYKSEFLANMSHELRTPLNSLLILAKYFEDNEEGNLSADQIKSANIIRRSGEDLLNLINDILDLAKIEAGKMVLHVEPISIADLAGEAREFFQHVAEEKGLEWRVEIDAGTPDLVESDAGKVWQIIKNLLANAFKFTTRGGVNLHIFPPDVAEWVVAIAVTDTGIGIPVNKQQLIFEAFQQGDGAAARQFGGTGLGLSISRELSHCLSGEIQVGSTVDKGTTFTLYLPAKPDVKPVQTHGDEGAVTVSDPPTAVIPEEADGQAVVHQPLARDLGKRTLLIIEDDVRFADILRNMAEGKGFHCLVADSGENGLALANRYRPLGILLDLTLPGELDGWQVMDRIKSNPDTKDILIHIISGQDQRQEGLAKGAVDFLTKPVSHKQLEEVFQRLTRSSSDSGCRLLILDHDVESRDSIISLIKHQQVEIIAVSQCDEAFNQLKKRHYDGMILNIDLPDFSQYRLLERISADVDMINPPVIVHTDRNLSREETEQFKKYTDSIVVKSDLWQKRLIDEVALFIHRVERDRGDLLQRPPIDADPEAVFKDRTILIVDDDDRNTFALGRTLKNRGLNILTAANGDQALEKLAGETGIDLVLMDIMLPGRDGYQMMAAIRQQERFKNLPIIALTAKAMAEDRGKCLKAGANDYLSKPVEMDRLFAMLRVWLQTVL